MSGDKKKIVDFRDVIADLKQNRLISESGVELLDECFSGIPLAVLKHKSKYSNELKKFALTLNFYSPKAYLYVRENFQLGLPHPNTIRRWYEAVDGSAGFTREAFEVIKKFNNNYPLLLNLTFDEMSIRKHVEFDGEKFVGYVDLGTGINNENLPIAKEAFVIMAVPLNGSWKIPVG